MFHRTVVSLALVAIFVIPPATAQQPDAAAERARLANQRIQAEAEMRARLEEERQRQDEQGRTTALSSSLSGESVSSPTAPESAPESPMPATASPGKSTASPDPVSAPGGRASDVSTALRQLKALGELRDAGYLDEAEFERIKRRILDDNF